MNTALARTNDRVRHAPYSAPVRMCVVTALPVLDHERAAWMACREMAIEADEVEATLQGRSMLSSVPPLDGESRRDYAVRAASAVMTAYVFGW